MGEVILGSSAGALANTDAVTLAFFRLQWRNW